MRSCKRVFVPPAPRSADSNIRPRYAIENACWIWHPDAALGETAALRFSNRFVLEKPITIQLHVSADQRYELSLDEQFISFGPHRCDTSHWSFSSYEIELEAGEHTLEAVVWWLGEVMPHAQMTERGGFICAAEGLEETLNTGIGSWQVSFINGWSYQKTKLPNYHVIGPEQSIDGAAYFAPAEFGDPCAIAGAVHNGRTGEVQGIWHLHPSPLPDMLRDRQTSGLIRAVSATPFSTPVTVETSNARVVQEWQQLLTNGSALTIAPRTKVHVLWDLEEYFCGYASVVLSGGKSSRLRFDWAESLFEVDKQSGKTSPNDKGNRDEVIGKVFQGFGDEFHNDGGDERSYQSIWWRSGRYVSLTVETADEPLRIERVEIIETRYPYEVESRWESDDDSLDATIPLMTRALQMCSHETYMDCPYYEQMMYVGDTRLEMLVADVMSADKRLTQRGIELFDWSRWKTGFVLERYPSTPLQVSLTFSLIWISMLRDYAWWHDDTKWVRERMVGMRGVIENFLPLLNEEGLLDNLPGWSFVDWVEGWDDNSGIPPEGEFGVSSVVNLLFVQSLQHAAELEDAYDEGVLAERYRAVARRTADQIVEQFWSEEKGMVADDQAHKYFSEHAQCLALLTEILEESKRESAFHQLLHNDTLRRTTIYFSFYLFDTLYKFNRGDIICDKMDGWKQLLHNGLKTTVEAPEPTRSDCHAWGAHPLFHFHASLAGIRPATPGFSEVVIAPSPGALTHIESTLPHPRGEVSLTLKVDPGGAGCHAAVTLPADVAGSFIWQGNQYALKPGFQTVVPASSS